MTQSYLVQHMLVIHTVYQVGPQSTVQQWNIIQGKYITQKYAHKIIWHYTMAQVVTFL